MPMLEILKGHIVGVPRIKPSLTEGDRIKLKNLTEMSNWISSGPWEWTSNLRSHNCGFSRFTTTPGFPPHAETQSTYVWTQTAFDTDDRTAQRLRLRRV